MLSTDMSPLISADAAGAVGEGASSAAKGVGGWFSKLPTIVPVYPKS